jgi:hypothetical protein
MYSAASQQLEQGLEMTRKMLELAKAGEWEQVAELGVERMKLLQQWVHTTDPAQAQQQIGVLQEIQKLDEEIETLGRQGREEIAQHLRQLHQGRKAGKAYNR